jgi:PAS domain S-box-containing protein
MMTGSAKTSEMTPMPRRVRVGWLVVGSSALAAATGLIVLAGWVFGKPALMSLWLDADDPVKASTAICFVIGSVGLLFSTQERRSWAFAYAARLVCGCTVFLLAGGSLATRLFEAAPPDPSLPSPMRMSVNSAVGLTAIGLSFLSPPSGEHGVWRRGSADSPDPFERSGPLLVSWKWWASQGCALVGLSIGYIAIVGHIYSADLLYGFSSDVNMALPSAIAVFLLGAACFFRERDAAFAAEVTSPMAGGSVLRWVTVTAAILLPLLGWLRLIAQDRQLIDYRLGAALFATSSVLLLAGGLWISARRLNHAAGLQLFAQQELAVQASLLERRVQDRTNELQVSEARFRLLAETSPALIFMTDPQMRFEFVNSAATSFFGEESEALGHRWRERIHPDDLEDAQRTLTRAASKDASFEFQMRLKRHDGQHRWMHVQGVPRHSNKGELLGFIGACLDVTDPQLAREALRESLSKQEEMLGREQSLRRELDHRVRNNLAGLLGLVAFYESSSRASPEAFAVASSLRGKIIAMKEVHDVIAKAGGGSVELRELASRLTGAMIPDERREHLRLEASRDEARVTSRQASALAIIIQELITNSFKHGALGHAQGRIDFGWRRGETDGDLILTWAERLPPGARTQPPRRDPEGGMGLSLISGFARTDLRGGCVIDAGPDHWTCTITARLDTVRVHTA